MTNKINASSAGLSTSVDTSGIIEFQTANTAAILIGTDQNANFVSTNTIILPIGTTAQRPSSPVNGMMRYNTTLVKVEGYANNTWVVFG